MDESLILTAVDLSGRAHLSYALAIPTEKVGTFDTELCEEFFAAFVRNAKCTLHIRQLSGTNSHHIIEGTSSRLRAPYRVRSKSTVRSKTKFYQQRECFDDCPLSITVWEIFFRSAGRLPMSVRMYA